MDNHQPGKTNSRRYTEADQWRDARELLSRYHGDALGVLSVCIRDGIKRGAVADVEKLGMLLSRVAYLEATATPVSLQ